MSLEQLVRDTDLEGATAEEILRWAGATFGDRLCVTSSMADALVIDLASRVLPGIDVVFLDTGYHFAETIGTRDAVAASYDINLITVTPVQTVPEQDAAHGERLYERDPDLCCALRKVKPLADAVAPYDAWISGIRRVETSARADTRVVEWDARRGKVKINPIAAWTDEQVETYSQLHGVLTNPLLSIGYASVGCAPCTSPAADRSGRWAGTNKTECGLHA